MLSYVLGFRLKGTTEWTRAYLWPLTRPFHEHVQTCVSVVIIKLSAY